MKQTQNLKVAALQPDAFVGWRSLEPWSSFELYSHTNIRVDGFGNWDTKRPIATVAIYGYVLTRCCICRNEEKTFFEPKFQLMRF